VLLDPDEPTWKGQRGGEGDKLFADVRAASDANLAPLLVKVVCDVPAASTSQAYAFRETFAHYAAVCPNRMRKELEKNKKLPAFDPKRYAEPGDPVEQARASLRAPGNFPQLCQVVRENPGWVARQPNRKEYQQAACAELDRALKERPPSLPLGAL